MLLQESLPEGQCPPPFMFPSPEVEAWLGCQDAGGAAAWGAGSQGSPGWHTTRSTGFLDSLPACFPLKRSMESTCSCEMFQFCKISIFQKRGVPLENFQPALIIKASLTSHTEVELKDIKFPSERPWAKCSPCLHPIPQPWSSRELSATAGWWFSIECHHTTAYSYSIVNSLTKTVKWQAPQILMWPNIGP